jgi:hypothetical protein
MKHIKRFNENNNRSESSIDDFEIGKKSVLMALDNLYAEYEDFTNDVSPAFWRTTGYNLTELRKMREDIERFK